MSPLIICIPTFLIKTIHIILLLNLVMFDILLGTVAGVENEVSNCNKSRTDERADANDSGARPYATHG